MSPQEAKFILDTDPAAGASLAYAALKHNQPMWRDLLDAGLPQAIRSNTGARRDLLERLIHVPDKDSAKLVLESIFNDMKKPQLEKLLCNERGGEVLVATWMRKCTDMVVIGPNMTEARFVGDSKQIDTLLGCIRSRGFDVNVQYKGKGKYGATYEASPLREIISNFLHQSYPIDGFVMPATKTLFKHGAVLDVATRTIVMGHSGNDRVVELISAFKGAGLAEPSEWLKSPGKDDKPDNIAFVQAMIAKERVAEINAMSKLSPS